MIAYCNDARFVPRRIKLIQIVHKDDLAAVLLEEGVALSQTVKLVKRPLQKLKSVRGHG